MPARQPPGASPIRQSSGRQSHTSFCDLARAYQAWAAKMQRSPPSDGPRPLSGVKGRPGTPVLRVLTASNLNQQGSVRATATQAPEAADTAQQLAATHTYYRYLTTSLHSAPLATHATQQRQRQRHASSRACATSLAFLGDANMDVETSSGNRGQRRESPKPSRLSILRRTLRKPRPPIRWPEPLLAAKARLATLDRSEVHLLYDLSKRLDWLCSELEPYRRPAQYLLIFNHWLNRKTWYVYDAPGRVPMQKRVEAALRRKGQKSRGGQEVALATESPGPPARADSHRAVTAEDSCARRRRRLQSWRIAVNVARHVARADSLKVRNGDAPAQASDPPDGALDPASWIIRRPPDGQSPAPRADTWYEGSGGLLQPYGRWQQVGGRPGRAIAGGDLLKRYHQVRAANSAATTDRGVAMAVRGAASRRTSATLVENVPPCEAVAGAPGPASASGVHTA
ncbi:hypothetical protein KEM52_000167 [Ascosphaera acerosa]|nr:hypothetical protein KEM52_000167 [Ascosphaera acerosa]